MPTPLQYTYPSGTRKGELALDGIAKAVLQGIYANINFSKCTLSQDEIGNLCYKQAEAMLRAKERVLAVYNQETQK